MAYSTQSDIEKIIPPETLVELTDDHGVGEVDASVVAAKSEDADEEIDSYLSMRYSLPLASTPKLVRRFSSFIAASLLYGRRPLLEVPKPIADECDRARNMLKQIAEGRLKLDAADPAEATGSGVSATTDKGDRVFSLGRSSDGSAGTLDNY